MNHKTTLADLEFPQYPLRAGVETTPLAPRLLLVMHTPLMGFWISARTVASHLLCANQAEDSASEIGSSVIDAKRSDTQSARHGTGDL